MITSCQFQWPTLIQLLPLQEHLISLPVLNGFRATRSLVLCMIFVNRCLSFCPFSFLLLLSVFSRITESFYPLGICKLFLIILDKNICKIYKISMILNALKDVFLERYVLSVP